MFKIGFSSNQEHASVTKDRPDVAKDGWRVTKDAPQVSKNGLCVSKDGTSCAQARAICH